MTNSSIHMNMNMRNCHLEFAVWRLYRKRESEAKSYPVWYEQLFDMWLSTLEIGVAQPRSVTEIAPKSRFLCLNRSPIQYDFRAGAKDIQYSVNIV